MSKQFDVWTKKEKVVRAAMRTRGEFTQPTDEEKAVIVRAYEERQKRNRKERQRKEKQRWWKQVEKELPELAAKVKGEK